MPSGAEDTGYSSVHSRNEDCGSPLCAPGNGGEGIILSKSSLSAEYPDPNALVDFFGGAVSAACVRSRISASFVGEPATPNGAGDCAHSYSPVNVPSGRGYCYGQPSMAMRPESSPDSNNLTRRSCSFDPDEPSMYLGHSAPMTALRGNRFLSSIGYGGSGPVSMLSATTVVGAAPPCADSIARTQMLEQELMSQCEENQRLRMQVSELRAELISLQEGSPQVGLDENPPTPGSVAQPEVARDGPPTSDEADRVVAEHEQDLAAAAANLATPFPARELQPGGKAHDTALLRVDTPPHAHEAPAPARSLSVELDKVIGPTSPAEELVPAAAAVSDAAAAAPAPQDGSSNATDVSDPHGEILGSPPAADAAVATPGCPPGLHPLLAVERRRTDQAHAALLFSSRQAQLLADKLAEAQYRADQLAAELKDWRRFCLANHRELMKHRKAAGAGAGRLFQ